MTERKLAIIGCGDVVQNRMLAAIRESGLHVACVVDVEWNDEKQKSLARSLPGDDPHRLLLTDPSGRALSALLSSHQISADAVIVASPTPTHADFTAALLERGEFVAVEKPLSHNRRALGQFRHALEKYGSSSLFAFGYYALEKGLSAFCVGLGDSAPEPYLEQLEPRLQRAELRDWRERLGTPRRIRGLLLEGKGSSSQLRHRHWVLEHANGGNTVETFYHLVSLVEPFVDLRQFTVVRSKLMVEAATRRAFETATGSSCAETMTAVELRSEAGVTVKLVCAKYVPPEQHQRWMQIECDEGSLHVNFETGTTRIESRNAVLELSLRTRQKYLPQFELLKARVDGRLDRCEAESFGRSLQLTFDIRDAGLAAGITDYDSGDLDQQAIARLVD